MVDTYGVWHKLWFIIYSKHSKPTNHKHPKKPYGYCFVGLLWFTINPTWALKKKRTSRDPHPTGHHPSGAQRAPGFLSRAFSSKDRA